METWAHNDSIPTACCRAFICYDNSHKHTPIEGEDTKPAEEYIDSIVERILQGLYSQSQSVGQQRKNQTFVDKLEDKVAVMDYAVCVVHDMDCVVAVDVAYDNACS